jgi:hypothetical protein
MKTRRSCATRAGRSAMRGRVLPPPLESPLPRTSRHRPARRRVWPTTSGHRLHTGREAQRHSLDRSQVTERLGEASDPFDWQSNDRVGLARGSACGNGRSGAATRRRRCLFCAQRFPGHVPHVIAAVTDAVTARSAVRRVPQRRAAAMRAGRPADARGSHEGSIRGSSRPRCSFWDVQLPRCREAASAARPVCPGTIHCGDG